MAFQLVAAVVNTLLLVLKIVAYCLVKKSFLLMMVIDNLADMIFSLVLCVPTNRYYSREVSRKICCRLMQLSQFVPVLMFISDLQRMPATDHKEFFAYFFSVLILTVQFLAKVLLYGFFKNKNFEKHSSDYLLLQDQIYDLFCTLPGILSMLLILTFRGNKEVIIDYVTTVILFALTISFWERTLIEVKKPKFESFHASLSRIVNRGKDRDDPVQPPPSKSSGVDVPSNPEEKKDEETVVDNAAATPSPQFERTNSVVETNNVVEMV